MQGKLLTKYMPKHDFSGKSLTVISDVITRAFSLFLGIAPYTV